MAERIQKLLSRAGAGSRRQIEQWIIEGRVRVNGQPAQIGQSINSHDRVTIDQRQIVLEGIYDVPPRVLLYRKPVGEIVSRDDPEGRPTVFKRLPRITQGRWIAVGRLDFNTSGLLIFTTDGELARRLMHPQYQIEREYAVRVKGRVDAAMLERLRAGVPLEDGIARFDVVETNAEVPDDDEEDLDNVGNFDPNYKANHWYHVLVREGRNRLVRRLWESQGVEVSRLLRVRYGPCYIPTGVKVGRGIELTASEIAQLMQRVDMEPPRSLANAPKSVANKRRR